MAKVPPITESHPCQVQGVENMVATRSFAISGCIYRSARVPLIAECRTSVVARPRWVGRIPRPPDDHIFSVIRSEAVIPLLVQQPVAAALRQGQHPHPTTNSAEHQKGARPLDVVHRHL